MKLLITACLAALALVLPSSAQGPCSTLTVTTAVDPVRPKQTVTVTVAGSLPDAPVFLAVGPTLGKTTIDLHGLGVLVLDLDRPFTTHLLGTADAQGDLSRSVTIPSDLALVLNAQAVALRLSRNPGGRPKADICTSNAVSFEL